MPEQKILVIDIGTNSILALLARIDGRQLSIISDQKKTTKLGEGLMATGSLSNEAMNRTAKVIMNFIENSNCDNILLIGTEALRVARNSNDFARLLFDMTAQRLTIISGELEAELSFFGAIYNLIKIPDNVLLIDVGGGSTELVRAQNRIIKIVRSIPIGALKLKELSKDDSLDAYITIAQRAFENNLNDLEIGSDTVILATGGTITSLAGILKNQKDYDSKEIHGIQLSLMEIKKIAELFQTHDVEKKRNLIPFDPDRADLILPGAGIYLAIMSIINMNELTVSTGGLRFGAALYPEKIKA